MWGAKEARAVAVVPPRMPIRHTSFFENFLTLSIVNNVDFNSESFGFCITFWFLLSRFGFVPLRIFTTIRVQGLHYLRRALTA